MKTFRKWLGVTVGLCLVALLVLGFAPDSSNFDNTQFIVNGTTLSLAHLSAALVDSGTINTAQFPALNGVVTTPGGSLTTSFGTFSSATLAAALTDKTGTGGNVFSNAPTINNANLIGTTTISNVAFSNIPYLNRNTNLSVASYSVNVSNYNFHSINWTNCTITLPAISNVSSIPVLSFVITVQAGSATITNANGVDKILGSLSQVITNFGASLTIYSDGTNWQGGIGTTTLGTANQVTVTTVGGSNYVAIANPLITPGPVAVTQLTNTSFGATGVVTNDANGKTYTTPTLQNALLANSTIGVGGTANQITSSSATPALGGSTTLAIANPLITPGPVAATQVTNTSFSAIGVVTNDANGKLYTTPTLPTSLMAGSAAPYSGNSGPTVVPISQTTFFSPDQSYGTNQFQTSDATGITRILMPFPGQVMGAYVITSANPGAVANTFTVMTNGVATGIVITLNNVTTGNDTAHATIPFLAGTELGVKIITGAGTAVKWEWGIMCRATSGF